MVQHDDSDEDISILQSLKNLSVVESSYANVKAIV
jgi:hypothetical protein